MLTHNGSHKKDEYYLAELLKYYAKAYPYECTKACPTKALH